MKMSPAQQFQKTDQHHHGATRAGQPYAQLVEMKQWADRCLYEAAGKNFAQLSPEDGSIMLRILDHIHTVDKIFQHHLLGLPHTFRGAQSEVMPDLATLALGTNQIDDWYLIYVNSLAAEDFDEPVDFVFTSGKPMQMTRGEIILHVCLHGTYHRGNAGAVLQLKGIAPSPDGFTNFLETAS